MGKRSRKTDDETRSYMESIGRLEEILEELEDAERVDVDHLAARVEEAAHLIRFCRRKLRDTELTVTRIVETLDQEAPESSGLESGEVQDAEPRSDPEPSAEEEDDSGGADWPPSTDPDDDDLPF